MIWLTLLAACGGPSEETLLDELRVVAVVAEPPAAGPGETVELTLYVADPAGLGGTVAAWTCTLTGETCLEGSLAEVSDWVHQEELDGEPLTLSVTVPIALSQVLSEETPELPVLLWVLACAPGACDEQLESWALGAELGTPVSDYYNQQLADPLSWLDELPSEGSSLALTTLTATTAEVRNQNPVLTADFDSIDLVDDTGVELPFLVEDDTGQTVEVYGFTTLGAFGMPVEAEEGEAAVTLYADGSEGTAQLYVIAQDGEGGAAVWTQTAELSP